ncbi:Uncharacterized protein RNJ44_03871 [Nakaseomyces bracarensis]|uniref:Cyclin N-terminal domain-containing protein n=1 Tax=Nakaseomyces bracarensis TaxID=273131 RepID=A0ABR4NY70_9SACH
MSSSQRDISSPELKKGSRSVLSEVGVNKGKDSVNLKDGSKPSLSLSDQEKKRHPMFRKPSRIRREDSDASYMANKKRVIFRDDEISTETHKRAKMGVLQESEEDEKWIDLDTREKDNICMVVEYTNDIFDFLYEREKATVPSHNYLLDTNSKFHLRPATRAVLVDWLVEVHDKFQCYTETLYLGINIMDRFLSQHKVDINKLQLLAVTSLFIAAKFEEINLPKLSEYAYITDGAATKEDIKMSEMFILTELKFSIDWPNPLNFLRRISKVDGYDNECRIIAKFILEYSMCSPKFVGELPSRLAAMSMFLARRILKREKPIWDATYKHYSGGIDAKNDLGFQELCIGMVKELGEPSTKLTALLDKFKRIRNGQIHDKTIDWCKDQVQHNCHKVFNV